MKAKVLCYGKGCGKFLHWGDTSDGKPSHGLCPTCEEIENEKVDEYFRGDEAPRSIQAKGDDNG